ncbi:hypothetical protein BC939DRAFT_506444 [Gamsiella multidivaricata]|uniref:uncharacterized protein n=1 Tax=Gamsiella multidivaricata TaxID=101098 RepID=UPI00221E405F|nr:uncharacterized protein BC939DRAFT_506444 [Gamsiella multidivaricata]KAI7818590.1 hypothetical protein BC939DRAFT_506444 [Gamsiella multidivaricata]
MLVSFSTTILTRVIKSITMFGKAFIVKAFAPRYIIYTGVYIIPAWTRNIPVGDNVMGAIMSMFGIIKTVPETEISYYYKFHKSSYYVVCNAMSLYYNDSITGISSSPSCMSLEIQGWNPMRSLLAPKFVLGSGSMGTSTALILGSDTTSLPTTVVTTC